MGQKILSGACRVGFPSANMPINALCLCLELFPLRTKPRVLLSPESSTRHDVEDWLEAIRMRQRALTASIGGKREPHFISFIRSRPGHDLCHWGISRSAFK
jgi:hypothetical protein